jgi:DNA-binding NtrC family response regulator
MGGVPPSDGSVNEPRRSPPHVLVATEDVELHSRLVGLLKARSIEAGSIAVRDLPDRLADQPTARLLLISDVDLGERVLEQLGAARACRPDLAVLVLCSRPTIQLASAVIRSGAEDIVPIPFSDEVLLKEVERVLDAAELRDRVQSLHRLVTDAYSFDRIVSRSARMRPVFERARAASRTDTPVLVTGETGTGKELVARALHANGRRAQRPFVPLNCAALPRDLVENELFGHRRGAFSGAQSDYPGLFVAAHGGTLFLDEIGELPLDAQAKLLRVLQDGEVRPVGGLESRKVDVRIVAATNRPLGALASGVLRQDLFFRLSVLLIDVPPLRERLDDLPLLVAHFLSLLRERGRGRVNAIDAHALQLLSAYPFPGNVRELESLVEGICITLPTERTSIGAEDVRGWLRRRGKLAPHPAVAGPSLRLHDLEAWAIGEALRRADGNKSRAAQLLGISRDTLYRKLNDLGVEPGSSDSRT